MVNFNQKINRVIKLYQVVGYFSAYTEIQLRLKCLDLKGDYESAENLSGLMSFIFKKDISASDLIPNEDNEANQIIILSEKLKAFEGYESMTKIDPISLKSIAKHIENNIEFNQLKALNHIEYSGYLNLLFQYMTKCISKEQFEQCYKSVNVIDGTYRKVNSAFFRKTIIKVEKLIDEILLKRKKRIDKK